MTLSSRWSLPKASSACACALALAGALLLPACAGAGGAAGGQAQEAASAETSEESASEPLSAEEMRDWITGAEGYKGRKATIVGQVFNVVHEDGITMIQVNTDLEKYADRAIILYEGDNPKIDNQSYVKADGVVGDRVDYKNGFGVEMNAPSIMADSVEELTYKDAVAPTTTSVEPAAVNEQNGYKVTIDTIEFSEKETRIYATVTNGGAGRFSLYTSSAAVVQDGIQYNTTNDFASDYPTFSNSIVPGASMSGVMTFPPLKAADLELWLQGGSDNYEVDKGKLDFNYKFNINSE